MMKLANMESKKLSKIAQTLDTEEWHNIWMSHGIEKNYFNKWFLNFETDTSEEEDRLEQIKQIGRTNKPIAFLGAVGNGKTHLAISILKDAIRVARNQRKHIKAGHYFTMSSLHREYRDTIKDPDLSEKKFFNDISTMECLIIDEIQIKSDSDSEQRFIQEVIDKRYSNQKQTIFIGNITVATFKSILGERLADRLHEQGIEIFVFNSNSYRRNDVS